MRTIGEQRKLFGLDLVESHNPEFLSLVRAEAVRIASANGRVTSDDLRLWANLNDIYPKHPNAWGAVFKGNHWNRLGFMKSRVPSNHARMISVWSIK